MEASALQAPSSQPPAPSPGSQPLDPALTVRLELSQAMGTS